MRLLLALLAASAALTVAPSASADLCVGDLCVYDFCYNDPCVEQSAGVGASGADVRVRVAAFNGFGAGAHAGPDSVYVTYGAGIMNCRYGVALDPVEPIYRCAV